MFVIILIVNFFYVNRFLSGLRILFLFLRYEYILNMIKFVRVRNMRSEIVMMLNIFFFLVIRMIKIMRINVNEFRSFYRMFFGVLLVMRLDSVNFFIVEQQFINSMLSMRKKRVNVGKLSFLQCFRIFLILMWVIFNIDVIKIVKSVMEIKYVMSLFLLYFMRRVGNFYIFLRFIMQVLMIMVK